MCVILTLSDQVICSFVHHLFINISYIIWFRTTDYQLFLLVINSQKLNIQILQSLSYACSQDNNMSGKWLFAPFYENNQNTINIYAWRTLRSFELFTIVRTDRTHHNDIEKSNHNHYIDFRNQKARKWKSTRKVD